MTTAKKKMDLLTDFHFDARLAKKVGPLPHLMEQAERDHALYAEERAKAVAKRKIRRAD